MNIWTGLLFMEGAVADVSLARELSRDEVSAVQPGAFRQTALGPERQPAAPPHAGASEHTQ